MRAHLFKLPFLFFFPLFLSIHLSFFLFFKGEHHHHWVFLLAFPDVYLRVTFPRLING